jgi:predicted dehydrogenase
MKVERVRVGIVGLGLVCDSHIKAYQANPSAEVVAVCDLDEARAKSVAREFGIAKYYLSFDEMMKDADINTVDITTPTILHAPMSLAAAKAGKNVLCEKPFCLTLTEAEAVCKEAEHQGVTLMVGESYIFMTSIMKARALIER